MNAYNLENVLQQVESWGLMDILLPFLFIFTIFYAILQKTKILGEDKKNFNVIVALVMAFSFVIPHVTGTYPADWDPVLLMNNSFSVTVLIIISMMAFFLIIGVLGGTNPKTAKISGWAFGLAVLFFINFAYPGINFGWSLVIALASLWGIMIVYHSSDHSETGADLVVSSTTFIAIATMVYIYTSPLGLFGDLPPWLKDSTMSGVIVLVAIIGVLVSFVTSDKK